MLERVPHLGVRVVVERVEVEAKGAREEDRILAQMKGENVLKNEERKEARQRSE